MSSELARIGAIGILDAEDIPELRAQKLRVFNFMLDGGWYTRPEIELAAGGGNVPAAEGMKRMRELRDIPGVVIDRSKRVSGRRQWHYQMRFVDPTTQVRRLPERIKTNRINKFMDVLREVPLTERRELLQRIAASFCFRCGATRYFGPNTICRCQRASL